MDVGYQYLLIEDAGPARIITLNRPDKRNALSAAVLIELGRALSEGTSDRNVRAFVIAGTAPAFSSGHDLAEMCGRGEPEYAQLFRLCADLMLQIQRVRQPVIAEINGIATAAGCQLVAGCDLAIASETSRFATPGVKIGLFCTTPMVPLVRCIGRKRAMEMLLTGSPITAATAAEWGLINRAVPEEDLRPATLRLAEQIAQASPRTIAIGKAAFYSTLDSTEQEAWAEAARIMTESALTPDAQEGISAFLGRRAAVWPRT